MTDASDLTDAIRSFGGDPADLPFWEGTAQGRFLLHRCGRCGRHYWPASRCIVHGAEAMAWVEVSGAGTLHTYTVMHHAYTPSMKGKVPYAVGVVQLREGPFFHSNVIDCPLDRLEVGMVLSPVMAPHDSGLTIPLYRPVETCTAG